MEREMNQLKFEETMICKTKQLNDYKSLKSFQKWPLMMPSIQLQPKFIMPKDIPVGEKESRRNLS
jgi:hypothetical protein